MDNLCQAFQNLKASDRDNQDSSLGEKRVAFNDNVSPITPHAMNDRDFNKENKGHLTPIDVTVTRISIKRNRNWKTREHLKKKSRAQAPNTTRVPRNVYAAYSEGGSNYCGTGKYSAYFKNSFSCADIRTGHGSLADQKPLPTIEEEEETDVEEFPEQSLNEHHAMKIEQGTDISMTDLA